MAGCGTDAEVSAAVGEAEARALRRSRRRGRRRCSLRLLAVVVPSVAKFLSKEEVAADALAHVAVAERDLLRKFKASCLMTFQARRLDEVLPMIRSD